MKKPRIEHRSMLHIHPFLLHPSFESRLTVRLLVPRTRTGTAELLGLAPPVVGNEECAVVLDEGLLELVLRVLVDVLLVVGNDGFGNGLADGVDLGSVSTTGDADADVDISWRYVSMPCSLLLPGSSIVCAYRTCQRRGSGRARRP
jgi:hypothetical protein